MKLTITDIDIKTVNKLVKALYNVMELDNQRYKELLEGMETHLKHSDSFTIFVDNFFIEIKK